MNSFERCGALQMVGHFPEHDPGAFGKRETRNAGADGGKRDAPQLLLRRDSQ